MLRAPGKYISDTLRGTASSAHLLISTEFALNHFRHAPENNTSCMMMPIHQILFAAPADGAHRTCRCVISFQN